MAGQPSDEHIEKALTALIDRAHGDNVSLGMFISKGIMLANGVALVACFTAIANGRVCDVHAFAPLIWTFATGMAFSLVALVGSFYLGLLVLGSLSQQRLHAATILNTGLSEDDRAAARILLATEATRFRRLARLPGMVQAMHALAALAFSAGVVAPLLFPTVLAALCSSGLPSA